MTILLLFLLRKIHPQRKRNSTDFLIDNRPNKTNVRAVVKPPKNYDVICINDEILSVMTSDVHANTTAISHTSKVGRKKEKEKCVNQ